MLAVSVVVMVMMDEVASTRLLTVGAKEAVLQVMRKPHPLWGLWAGVVVRHWDQTHLVKYPLASFHTNLKNKSTVNYDTHTSRTHILCDIHVYLYTQIQ